MPNRSGHVTITFHSEKPQIKRGADGDERIVINNFGYVGTPGAPKLPTMSVHVEFPKNARIGDMEIINSESSQLPGLHRISAAGALVEDRPVGGDKRARIIAEAKRNWTRNHERIYRSDGLYPKRMVTMFGAWEMYSCSVAILQINPVQYSPREGKVLWHRSIKIVITYALPGDTNIEPSIIEMETFGESRINPFQELQLPSFPISPLVASIARNMYNYIIIVPNLTVANAMFDFKVWKETIGHNVIIYNLADILADYSGIDDPERVRNFLIDRHNEWPLRYVLLVGRMGTIPTRLLYMNESANAYASDYYYAELMIRDWDLDDDNRWGEFDDDRYNTFHDIVVGRLPLDSAAEVQRYCNNVIAFEQDQGPWKKNALFAAGIMDHDATDGAELCERLIDNVLSPAGWNSRTLYEHGGTNHSSKYASDADLNQANYVAECLPQSCSIVCLASHGNPNGMAGQQCADPPLNCHGAIRMVDNWFGLDTGVRTNCPSAIVSMIGCDTAAPQTEPGYATIEPLRSLFPFTQVQMHNGVRYLQNGAVAAIGSSSGADYRHLWTDPSDGYMFSLAYYFHEQIITHRKPVGDAFFDAMYIHANKHKPLARGVRDFYLMGDPTLMLESISSAQAGATDVLVHHGRYTYFSACNDHNGDIYVVVSIGSVHENGEIIVYKSTNHGLDWLKWKHFSVTYPVVSVDAIVNHAGSDEFKQDDLLIFVVEFVIGDGSTLRMHKLPLSNNDNKEIIISKSGSEVFNVVSVSQDNLSAGSYIYLGYTLRDQNNVIHSIVGVSHDNGLNWIHWHTFHGYYFPAIDAGPGNMVYVAMISADWREHVYVSRSDDGGASWGNLIDLTGGASTYKSGQSMSPITVAASPEPGKPCVWVACDRIMDGSYGPIKHEIGFAFSENAGIDWVHGQTLASGPGNLESVQLLSNKADPGPGINVTYISSINSHEYDPLSVRIMSKAVSAEWPARWSSGQICNHAIASSGRPRFVYSPGAPGTGGGVVYGGHPAGVYFSAPWLTN